jgi:hypothetical protein
VLTNTRPDVVVALGDLHDLVNAMFANPDA